MVVCEDVASQKRETPEALCQPPNQQLQRS